MDVHFRRHLINEGYVNSHFGFVDTGDEIAMERSDGSLLFYKVLRRNVAWSGRILLGVAAPDNTVSTIAESAGTAVWQKRSEANRHKYGLLYEGEGIKSIRLLGHPDLEV